jgi:predicted Zn-dependent peptidase
MDETVEITELGSGLRIATERVPSARSVSAGAWIGVGARDEPAAHSGVSHFLEHLLFKGTEQRSARDIAFAVDRVGGDMNAFTAKEYTAFYCRLPADALPLGVELLGDVLTRPALRDVDVESERQVILEELAMDDDQPEDVAHRLLAEALFPEHPLGRETAGSPRTVAALSADDVREFFDHWYRQANTVIAVAGPVDHEAIVREVAKRFGERAGGERPQRAAPLDGVSPLVHERRPAEQVQLVLGYRGVGRWDPDRETLDVLNHVLGGGPSSRLFEEVRERRGLAYAVGSSSMCYADTGSLTLYAGTAPGNATELMRVVDGELARIADGGVTDDELAVATGYLTGAYVLGLEDTGSRMARLGGSLTVYGEVRPVAEQLARWRAVGHDDLRRVAQRVLLAPRALSVVGPLPRKAAVALAA